MARILTTLAEHPATMSPRGDIHLGMDLEEIARQLEMIFGPPKRPAPRLTDRTLDEILASRTHVRVLRVLVALDKEVNLTARDVARRSGASRGRVLEALRQLSALGLLTAHHAPTHTIYCLADDHPLTCPVHTLFDAEREL